MALKKDCLKKLPGRLKATFFNTLHTLPITIACMTAATLTANALFHLSGNAINVSIIYILAILLHAQYTKCYSAGIIASIYSVFWVNYAYTYPYMTLNFTLSGYPLTFVGMTFISCFTSSICIMLSKQSAQIQEKDRMLMQAEKETMRANLLRAISHDLRTPLTSISGNAGILMENGAVLDEEKRRYLYRSIYDDSMWLINLVENLLSLTRMGNGSVSLNIRPELLDEVFHEALSHLDRNAEQHHISVELEDDLLMADMDARLIVQVVINLVNNAIKYTPAGSHISLSAVRAGPFVQVEVSDDGPGIADSAKQKIFDMFYTADNSRGDGRRGLGLGLSLCRSIITAHGGEISVQDHQPHGSVFRFTLRASEVKMYE